MSLLTLGAILSNPIHFTVTGGVYLNSVSDLQSVDMGCDSCLQG